MKPDAFVLAYGARVLLREILQFLIVFNDAFLKRGISPAKSICKRKQIRLFFSFYSEGLILGSIGIPLGLLMGLIGTKITLTILGSRILEADIIQGAEGMRGSIPIVCSPWVILAIVVFYVATILISTWVPSRKAAEIMPIGGTSIKTDQKQGTGDRSFFVLFLFFPK